MNAEDEAAFRDFVTARSATLLRTAYLLTGDFGLAEDAVQAMFGRVYLTWPNIRHREAADSYCRRALVREVSSWRRRRRVTVVLIGDVPEALAPQTDEPAAAQEQLWSALLTLPIRQRAVVVLRYYADMSEAEVASTLDISTGSVKQHAHRALAKLRVALGASGELGATTDLIEEIER